VTVQTLDGGPPCLKVSFVDRDRVRCRALTRWQWTGPPFFGSRATFFVDVTGDGKADAITVNDDTVLVRRSTGSGFGPAGDWTLGPSSAAWVPSSPTSAETARRRHCDQRRRAYRTEVNGEWLFDPGVDLDPGPYLGSKGVYFADTTNSGEKDVIAVGDEFVTVCYSR
jgi:hypothetical protein